jgi:hypothetical protein
MQSDKKFLVIALVVLMSISGAHAGVNFFVSQPQPWYVPVPMPVVAVPAPATVGFSVGIPLGDPEEGAPTLGLSVDVPLVEPAPIIVNPVVRPRPVIVTRTIQPTYIDSVCRDDEDRRYWRIYNNTNKDIQVMSKTESKLIKPGQSRKLDHSTSFTLKVTDGDQKIRVRTTRHTLYVAFNNEQSLKICADQ